MNKITREAAAALMRQTNGHVFSVTFIKKDGSERDMTCRLGVKKHLRGGERAYDPADYDLLCVFDMAKEAYRSISLNTLKRVKVEGTEYEVLY